MHPAHTLLHPRHRRRSLQRSLTAMLVAVTSVATLYPNVAGASARSTPSEQKKVRDLQSKRNAVRASRARKAASVDALKSTDAQIRQALDTLDANLATESNQLDDAERAQAQALDEQRAADAAATRAEGELSTIKISLKRQAIHAYVNVPGESQWSVLTADDALTAVTKDTMLAVTSSRNLDAVERYRAVREDLAAARAASAEAAARAAAHSDEVRAHLDQIQAAQAQQQRFGDQVADRIADEQAEADALAGLDSQLSSEISKTQAALAARLAAQQRAAAAARATLAKAGRRTSTTKSTPSRLTATVPHSVGSGSLATVRGITVDASIAGSLAAMLDAAAAAGISLSGSGYRNPAGQIAVRRNNCGSSNYAIYEAPASSCHPPTAIPGRSQHERGLAIDFTSGGSILTRSSAAFGWLKANAARFGFYNLPSEAWHWSTTGN